MISLGVTDGVPELASHAKARQFQRRPKQWRENQSSNAPAPDRTSKQEDEDCWKDTDQKRTGKQQGKRKPRRDAARVDHGIGEPVTRAIEEDSAEEPAKVETAQRARSPGHNQQEGNE